MKYSVKELFKFINSDVVSKDQLVDLFTDLAYEVEEVIPANIITGVKLGKTLECVPHPNADTLSYCKVETDGTVMDVVCGGANVATGQVIAHALPGSKVGEMELQPKELRGIESNGMILSISEIGGFDKSLVETANQDNILVFPESTDLSSDVAELVDMDTDIYDLSILPDRQYALSYLKMAKEMAAFLNVDYVEPNPTVDSSLDGEANYDNNLEASFAAVVTQTEGTTSEKMKAVLYHGGVQPTNTISDIFEYVKLLTGSDIKLVDNTIQSNSDPSIKGSSNDSAELGLKLTLSFALEAGYISAASKINGNAKLETKTIELTEEKLAHYTGVQINLDEIKSVLGKLGFVFEGTSVEVPSYRTDVTTTQELIEEVMRVYKIKNVNPMPFKSTREIIPVEKHAKAQRSITEELVQYGFQDVKTYQLVTNEDAVKYNINNVDKFIKLNDDYTLEYNTVQTSLLKGLIDVHLSNYRNDHEDIRVFELSNIFDDKVHTFTLGILHDTKINEEEPILATKAMIEKTIVSLGLDLSKLTFEDTKQELFNDYITASILYDGANIGILGELHPRLLREFKYIRLDKVKEKLYYAELKLENII